MMVMMMMMMTIPSSYSNGGEQVASPRAASW